MPDDIHGMEVAQGILTATGGMTSHAAVVGRQMGKPSVVGAGELHIDEKDKTVNVGGQTVKEGDWISFDGLTGEVKLGQVATKPSEILQVLAGKMKPEAVRHLPALRQAAHVGRQGADARHPRQRRPAGPGRARLRLRRARHRAVPHRAHVLRRGAHREGAAMILADNEADRRAALNELLPLQRADFYGVFKAMHGEPVTIRTIDPPLHEFLPKREDLMVEIARLEATGKTSKELDREAHAAAPRRAAARVQPDARPPRRASRDHLPGDHRDAGAGHLRGRLRS